MSELTYNNTAYLDWMLSQMMDGQLNEKQTEELVRALFLHPELQAKWRHWHLIREAMYSDKMIMRVKKTDDNHSQKPLQKQAK